MATLLGLLPLILSILGQVLKWYGAGEDVLAQYQALVDSTAKSGLITADSQDVLRSQRQKILDRMKAKNPPVDPPKV